VKDRIRVIFLASLSLALMLALPAQADTAVQALGRDFEFPQVIAGTPSKLSGFSGLQINSFVTSDGVRIAYWEAGNGRPLVFVPGWSSNGADYIYVMYLLSRHYHVFVIDPRNQGLSQHVDYGTRIARFAADLHEFVQHARLSSADFCGHSMGSSILWSYIDLYGTKGIRKLCFIDEPVSIYGHSDWSEAEMVNAGSITHSAEEMVAAFTRPPVDTTPKPEDDLFVRFAKRDSPYFANAKDFAQAVIKNDPNALGLVLFDHAMNDWRDVLRHKIDRPTAIFSGEYSRNLPSQRWMQSVIRGAVLYDYSKADQGDHFLAFKNPVKFTGDLREFLER